MCSDTADLFVLVSLSLFYLILQGLENLKFNLAKPAVVLLNQMEKQGTFQCLKDFVSFQLLYSLFSAFWAIENCSEFEGGTDEAHVTRVHVL